MAISFPSGQVPSIMTSPSGIELVLATILATSVECILYGISLIMCGGTMWALAHGRPKNEINWSMVLVALIFTILSTIHMSVDIKRLIDGFVPETEISPRDPTSFFSDMTQQTFVIKTVVYVLQTLLGDAVVIYRCYVVWQRLRIIMVPVVLWCAASVTSVGFLYRMLHATGVEDIFLSNIAKWVIPFYVLTMATNVFSSSLLAYRIWTANQDVPGVVRVLSRSGVEANLLLRVLVDSALLYTLTLFALLVCYADQNVGQFIVRDMMTPIISITFYTVLVRIAIARSTLPPPAALSPLRFAVRVMPSPSEPTFTGARRSSV